MEERHKYTGLLRRIIPMLTFVFMLEITCGQMHCAYACLVRVHGHFIAKLNLLNPLSQGSSTFQIVRATLTISMMPAGHKAILRHLEL
jgi:hypothetical protein